MYKVKHNFARLILLILALAAVVSLTACSNEEIAQPKRTSYEDYIGADVKIAVQSGDVMRNLAENFFKLKDENITEFSTMTDCLAALDNGKVDAVLLADGYIGQLKASGEYPNFDYLVLPEEVYVNRAAPVFHTEELRDQYNEWFAGIKADGTWQEICDFWIGGELPAAEDIPQFEFTGENGTLVMVDNASYPPLSYIGEGGEMVGFDVDMMNRFAIHMGMNIEYRIMAYDAVLPYITSGKADATACTLTITDERADNVIFGEPSVITRAVLIVPEKVGTTNAPADSAKPLSYKDFKGKKFVTMTGTIYDSMIEGYFEASDLIYVQSNAQMLETVRLGKADAMLMSTLTVDDALKTDAYSGLRSVVLGDDVPLPGGMTNDIAVISGDQEIVDQYNAFLKEIKSNGVLDEMIDRWVGGDELPKSLPDIPLTGENGTLTAAITGSLVPFGYVGDNGEFLGLEVEQLHRFAQYLGKDINIEAMDFDAIIPYVMSGKADIGASDFGISEERKKNVIFGDPYYKTYISLVYKADSDTAAEITKDDFIGRSFATTTGTIYDMLATDYFQASEVLYVQSNTQAVEMVRAGKAEAMMLNAVMTDEMLRKPEYSMLASVPLGEDVVFPEGITNDVAVLFNNQSMADKYNAFLKEMRADGTLDEMLDRWISGNELPDTMPDIPLTNTNGTLTVAITGEKVPFDYVGNDGEVMGLEVEQARRFAAYLGMDVEFKLMDFGAIIPYVVSGKADIGASDFNVTDERKKSVIFGDPYFKMGYRIIFRKADFGIADTNKSTKTEYTDFIGDKFGVLLGTGYEALAEDVFEAKSIDFYGDNLLAFEALRSGHVNALIGDLTSVVPVLRGMGADDLTYTVIPADRVSYDYAAFSNSEEIVAQFNEFLPTIVENGILDEMKDRWIHDFDPNNFPDMPDIPLTGENGVLRVSTSAVCTPFVMLGKDGECTGFEIELMRRFAQYMGKSIEIFEMDYSGMLPHVKSGKSDICAAMCYSNLERIENIYFTDSYHLSEVVVIHRSDYPSGMAALDYTDFIGKQFAIRNGTVYDAMSEGIFQSQDTLYFNADPEVYEAVRLKKADAALQDYILAKVMLSKEASSDLTCIKLPEDMMRFPIACVSMDEDIIAQYNQFLAEIKANGIYDEMTDRWFDSYDATNPPVMPDIPLTGSGKLVAATSGTTEPFSFIGNNGALQGFDVEQLTRFAQYLGMGEIELMDMEFGALIPAVVSGKAQIAASEIFVTDERKKSVLFTDEYYEDYVALIYRKDFASTEAAVKSDSDKFNFIEWAKRGIENNLITENRWKMIVDGLLVTLQIAVLSQLSGTLMGCLVCYLLTRKNKIARGIVRFYNGIIHGTPMVVLLMVSYYIIFGKSDISAVLIAVAAFTLVEGVGIGERLFTAISTIDPVEVEAARSMGFSSIKAFFNVTLPQAVKIALPGYMNGFVELVKSTAIVGYIAIQDLSRAGDIIRSRTYDAYFPLLFVALIYLLVTTACVQIFKLIIRRVTK